MKEGVMAGQLIIRGDLNGEKEENKKVAFATLPSEI